MFVSTSPDFDARYALAVLRGALGIPTRGFFRVAPGEWRVEGALTPIPEADVRQAVRDAPVAIIHGDTAAFGPPRTITLGPLALIVTTATDGEWYPSAAPPSPLAPALSGFVWDSLPPVGIATTPPHGTWEGVEARRGRGDERKPIVVGTDEPRRVAIVAASGLWRWRFRGGVASDAFTALWGSIFDWLAAERADRRAAVPDERVLRAGDPMRWRRGSATRLGGVVALQQRGATRVDSLTLRFAPGVNVVETPAAAGGYLRGDDARRDGAAGGQSVARMAAARATRRDRRGSRADLGRRRSAVARRGMGVRAGDLDAVRRMDSAAAPRNAMRILDRGSCGYFVSGRRSRSGRSGSGSKTSR